MHYAKNTVIMTADIAMLVGSMLSALALRFEGMPILILYQHYLAYDFISFAALLMIYILLYNWFRLYNRSWRTVGLDAVRSIIYANTLGITALITLQQLTKEILLPRSVILIFWMLSIISTGGMRVGLRICINALKKLNAHRTGSIRRTIIIGSETTTAPAVKMIREQHEPVYEIVGILEDNTERKGTIVDGVRVLGSVELLKELISKKNVEEVIVAIPHGTGKTVFEYVRECRRQNVPIKVVPGLADLQYSPYGASTPKIPEDYFLKRPVLKNSQHSTVDYMVGKKVLVTGAGGSIGSELCRQIITGNPMQLILLGHGENSIHQIWQELSSEFPDKATSLECVICSVADQNRINSVIEDYRPNVVFHTAAHKHVPLMESNEAEAVHNNIIGTAYLADACGQFGVERFVLISTDKAAEPCSIMGSTKWLCEEVIRGMDKIWCSTSYITVRFGNVLGSRGSVLKIFQEQIKKGGPVTVTHPEMTRYFMTIPEAVHLVIQVGGMGKSGELYLLDMGRPIRLTDLAEDLIRMYGLEPWVDIDIKFSGIRPGERLHEKLISENESIRPSDMDSIFVVDRPNYFDTAEIIDIINRLEHISSFAKNEEVRRYLSELITEKNKSAAVPSASITGEILGEAA